MNVTKICVDPGHGGKDPGAVYEGLTEDEIVWAVSKKYADMLEVAGIQPVFTRSADTFTELGERWRIANRENCDLFLSIHANAGGGTGYEVWTSVLTNRSDIFATYLFGAFSAEFPELSGRADREDGDVDKEGHLAVLHGDMPSALFELAFIDTEGDRAMLVDDATQHRMARALFNGTIKMVDHMRQYA